MAVNLKLKPTERKVILHLAKFGPKSGIELWDVDKVLSSGVWNGTIRGLSKKHLIQQVEAKPWMVGQRGGVSKYYWLTGEGVEMAIELDSSVKTLLPQIIDRPKMNTKDWQEIESHYRFINEIQEKVGLEQFTRFRELIGVVLDFKQKTPDIKMILELYKQTEPWAYDTMKEATLAASRKLASIGE